MLKNLFRLLHSVLLYNYNFTLLLTCNHIKDKDYIITLKIKTTIVNIYVYFVIGKSNIFIDEEVSDSKALHTYSNYANFHSMFILSFACQNKIDILQCLHSVYTLFSILWYPTWVKGMLLGTFLLVQPCTKCEGLRCSAALLGYSVEQTDNKGGFTGELSLSMKLSSSQFQKYFYYSLVVDL